MAINRRGFFSFLPAAAAIPLAPLVGREPRDLVITVPGVTVSNSSFRGGIKLAENVSRCIIENNHFDTRQDGGFALQLSPYNSGKD